METVIAVEQLRKAYAGRVAVEDVSFTVRRGEIFGILGPNGAGKTTTVECLQGLRDRTGGELSVLGLDPARDAAALRRRIGSQLQSSALPERLQVAEAIRLFARLRDAPVDLDATLAAWGLTEARRHAYGSLSGGQQQRVFLALALLGDPELVFLDELTTGLDPTARRATWELVAGVRDRGATVVLVTHFMEEAEALCDRVAVVDRGRVVACGTPAALTAQSGPIRMSFTLDGHDPSHLLAVAGVESVTVAAGRVTVTGHGEVAVRVAAALAERGVTPADYRTHYPTLEDVFLNLTGHRLTEGVPS
ncbi:MAG TPA: ABC transporter ATP-binding protein [Natronosporangium sp.]